MKMLSDAKRGKFDLIVTREVCRFARNTVDTLQLTRELRNFGVEVFFVSDNIWTMDGDGELRLSIMATMAQEESRKISERVLAGQKISRQKGVLYGSGNIIGYDRDNAKRTYVINEEQAATIRMVFTLYSQGYGEKAIVNELSRLGCKDGHGNVSWSCTKISRILRNATYMGYICYNKSKVNNYLEKKRINNLDEDSFVYVKGNFEPIVSESLWHECERIRKSRISSLRLPDGETRRKGTKTTKNLWVSKLRCRCGSSYRIFKWRKLKDGTPVFGYQCNMRTVNPTRSFVLEHGLTDQLSCDAISVPEWKLDLMAKKIFEKVWGNQNKAILLACQMIEGCKSGKPTTLISAAPIQSKIEKIKNRKMNYAAMRADGELGREEYQALCKQADDEINRLEQDLKSIAPEPDSAAVSANMKALHDFLEQKLDVRGACLAPELIEQFGIPYHGISTGKLRRYFSVQNFTDPFRVIKGLGEAKKLVKILHPDVIFSKGGFVSVPVVLAGKSRHVPTIIHESDMTPGLANKISMPSASKISAGSTRSPWPHCSSSRSCCAWWYSAAAHPSRCRTTA